LYPDDVLFNGPYFIIIHIREHSKITSSRHKGGGVSEKMILDYVGGGGGIAEDDG
jgi:hypothetical protein